MSPEELSILAALYYSKNNKVEHILRLYSIFIGLSSACIVRHIPRLGFTFSKSNSGPYSELFLDTLLSLEARGLLEITTANPTIKTYSLTPYGLKYISHNISYLDEPYRILLRKQLENLADLDLYAFLIKLNADYNYGEIII